jgi:hypothetical protein
MGINRLTPSSARAPIACLGLSIGVRATMPVAGVVQVPAAAVAFTGVRPTAAAPQRAAAAVKEVSHA